ncbi:hypothetical protein ATO13_08516 [Stappia sp. 22II-S9-Z10]|nr:hypothetical protein ATO13_08516 [Stappia sp. 22II-S9-Z10]
MALDLLPWTGFILKLGDGEASEDFTAPTMFRQKAINFTSNTSEAFPVDDVTPEAPPWRLANTTGRMATITGTGLVNMNDEGLWRAWFMSGLEKNCQLLFNKPSAANGGHYQAPFLYTSANYTADRDSEAGRVLIEVELQSCGPLTFTPASGS